MWDLASVLTTGELWFEYFWGFSEIDIEAAVVFFGALGGWIEAKMTKMRLHLSSYEELDLESLLLLLGVSKFPMDGLLVIFVLYILIAL